MLQLLFEGLSTLVAFGALAIGLTTWRADQLRRDEVLDWANQVINAMNEVRILCGEMVPQIEEVARGRRLAELAIETSSLLERGRLFFRNRSADGWGRDKEAAYRGFRPKILDHVLVAHLIARNWVSASDGDRRRMGTLSEHRVQAFVSLAQKEVGRSRTSSFDTKRAGASISLHSLLAQIESESAEEADRRGSSL
jgi:hypothetical protein